MPGSFKATGISRKRTALVDAASTSIRSVRSIQELNKMQNYWYGVVWRRGRISSSSSMPFITVRPGLLLSSGWASRSNVPSSACTGGKIGILVCLTSSGRCLVLSLGDLAQKLTPESLRYFLSAVRRATLHLLCCR